MHYEKKGNGDYSMDGVYYVVNGVMLDKITRNPMIHGAICKKFRWILILEIIVNALFAGFLLRNRLLLAVHFRNGTSCGRLLGLLVIA